MAGKRNRSGADSTVPPSKKLKNSKKNDTTPELERRPFVESPTGPERARESNLYEVLASELPEERNPAAVCIVANLIGIEPVPEVTLERHLRDRLFRGLASGRKAARVGFGEVITEILTELWEKDLGRKYYSGLTFEKLLDFLVTSTEPTGNIPGQEERDHHIGRLFGLHTFVRSKFALQDKSRWLAVLNLLLNLAYRKASLRSACASTVLEAIEQIQKDWVVSTLEKVSSSGLARTPEGVAFWLAALDRFPELSISPWQNPLSRKSLNDLGAVLKESGSTGDDDLGQGSTIKQGNRMAEAHFVWDKIMAYYIKDQNKPGHNPKDFEVFWKSVVNDHLFSNNATDGQKYKGFMVFQKYLTSLVDYPSYLESLFSKNLMTCLLNQAANKDRYLHRAAIKTLKVLENTVSEHPSTLVPILKNLLSENGVYNFDQRTNTKTVAKLLQCVNEQNGAACLEIVKIPIPKLGQEESQKARVILDTYLDYLSKILVATGTSTSENTSSETKLASGAALQELSALAYSQPKHIPESLLTEKVKELCRSRLESSLAKLIRQGDNHTILCNAVLSMDTDLVNMEDEIATAVKEARSRLQKLLKRTSKSSVEKSLTQGLALLHAVSLFQMYNEDPDAMEVLQDLAQFSDRLKKGKLENDEGSSELLIEILLSMVARPSSLMREVSQQVFDTFTGQVSAEGLELLTTPLASDESAKGQQELFNIDGDEMEVDEEGGSSEDDDEEDDDDEDDDGDEDDENEEDENEGEDEDEDDDQEGKKDDPVDLDELIGNILNSHRLDKDAEAESSEDDGDMSDSEMLALDEKLAEVIRPHVKRAKDSKKQKKDAKQSVVNFKHRILDLLKIYIKNEVLNPLSFSLLVPLLNLVRTTSTKPLANRAHEIILDYRKGLKKALGNKQEFDGVSTEDLLGVLIQVHEEAGNDNSNSHAYAKAASAASLIVVSAMLSIDRDSWEQAGAVYLKTEAKRFHGKITLQRSFFDEWSNWSRTLYS
ncbi:unnamed protein product [Clonostachys rosea]|uniref:DNA polymerase V n=1 Tax=Bionectria ochroleuca TaxID=29856 RepID=A0ABY6U7Q8_BIOOC|nr:unnamed protein product [Clonostachys rosea]